MIGETALASITGLGLEPVDEIDHVVEPAARAAADAASDDGDGKMGLAGAGSADQDDIALLWRPLSSAPRKRRSGLAFSRCDRRHS